MSQTTSVKLLSVGSFIARQPFARFSALAASGRYPYFAKLTKGVPEGFAIDLDELFEIGLAALLDGFARRIESEPPAPRRTPRSRE